MGERSSVANERASLSRLRKYRNVNEFSHFLQSRFERRFGQSEADSTPCAEVVLTTGKLFFAQLTAQLPICVDRDSVAS